MRRVTLLLALTMIVTGCGDSTKSGGGTSGAGGPKDAVKKAAEAMKAGDAAALKDCYIHNAEGARLLEAMAASGKVGAAFCEKMQAAYGKDAVPETMMSVPLRMLTDFDKANLYGGQDGKASVIYNDPFLPLNVREVDGVWKILGPPADATAEDVDRYVRLNGPMQKGMESVLADIGKEGVTKDEIMKRVGEVMAKEMN